MTYQAAANIANRPMPSVSIPGGRHRDEKMPAPPRDRPRGGSGGGPRATARAGAAAHAPAVRTAGRCPAGTHRDPKRGVQEYFAERGDHQARHRGHGEARAPSGSAGKAAGRPDADPVRVCPTISVRTSHGEPDASVAAISNDRGREERRGAHVDERHKQLAGRPASGTLRIGRPVRIAQGTSMPSMGLAKSAIARKFDEQTGALTASTAPGQRTSKRPQTWQPTLRHRQTKIRFRSRCPANFTAAWPRSSRRSRPHYGGEACTTPPATHRFCVRPRSGACRRSCLKSRHRAAYVRLQWDTVMGDDASDRQLVNEAIKSAIDQLR